MTDMICEYCNSGLSVTVASDGQRYCNICERITYEQLCRFCDAVLRLPTGGYGYVKCRACGNENYMFYTLTEHEEHADWLDFEAERESIREERGDNGYPLEWDED